MSTGTRHAVVQHASVYDVLVRVGLLSDLAAELTAAVGTRRRVAITDEHVAPYLDGWTGGEAPWDAVLTVVPGEAHKTRASWSRLTDELLDLKLGRDGAIIAIGGGVIGDLAGFVASTYLRGIPVVQVPTTLLAMVDASVGGKVGVDTQHGKNLVGAFHPPVAVLADPAVLWTLPPRDFIAGLAETVKHGLLADARYFQRIHDTADAILARDLATLEALVSGSVAIKAAVVMRDPLEQGERATLNVGHTIGHAVEHALDYELFHGECVAIGLVAECKVAETVTGLDAGVTESVRSLLALLGLPVRIPEHVSTEALLDVMRLDKKNRDGVIRLALPAALGRMHHEGEQWTQAVPATVIAAAIDASR